MPHLRRVNGDTVCMQYIINGRKHQTCVPLRDARHHHRWILEQGGTVYWTWRQ
jgi:hypothetical protein